MKGDIHEFTVIGVPIAKKRPRFVTNKNANGEQFTRNVNIQQTEEGRFVWEILTKWNEKPLLIGALKIEFSFVFTRPKSHYGTGRNSEKLKASSPEFCDKIVKDCDNLEKFAMDSMNKFIYLDDRQVVSLSSEKIWGEYPKTLIKITELN